MALGEGLRGEALLEIRKAIYLPYDAHTIRVGLRDIHRHLKSYFIPKEGFLAGITLNVENVSINPEYIQLLKFYGYDIDSFNTALYPEKHITTTESGIMDGREETTLNTDSITISSTVNSETTENNLGDRTTPEYSIETTAPTTQFSEKTDQTITESVTSTVETTKQTEMPTENSVLMSTTPTTEATIVTQSTQTTTDSIEISTKGTESFETTQILTTLVAITDDTMTSDTTSAAPEIITEKEMNGKETPSVEYLPSSTTEVTTIGISTTESIESSSIISSTEETTELFTSVTNTPASNVETTTSEINEDETPSTTPKVRNIRASEESQDLGDNEDYFENEDEQIVSKQLPESVVTESNTEGQGNAKEFGSDDWRIRINNQLTLLNSNQNTPFTPSSRNTAEIIINKERRISRSIEEYVITRFYHYNNFRPTKPYEPNKPLYFFVNDKNKEAGLDFMTYDSVLPFLYIPSPSAMALAFPLDSEKYYLLLLLPSEDNTLDDVICKLYMHNTFKYILNNLELTHVRVNIPSFNLNGRITLTNTLQKLGIQRIFEPRQADFSPMTSTEDVYVTNIEQAISVTIKNNLNIKKDTRHGHHYYSEPIRFDVNRPFLYFVIDSELQIILMAGKVVNPLNIRIK
ncbi:uncharacterized protein LOC123678296 isoform X2 [Harmonia axyridis]|nr:uncharacterized protein LOC123678296 isoform X2 [Harmonia axyridis]